MNEDFAQQIHRENLWLRELLRKVSADLEHIAGDQPNPAHREMIERRAMLIRKRLWDGMPREWESKYGG